ncbi:MAG: hypothetical protein QOI83_4698, partial [Streptomycetaceae bacterium]|nr:hypothetical protein [Streptomycetaceae bacterium]
LAIWGIVSLTTAEVVYPCWRWVAGPRGLVLLARILGDGMWRRFSTRF